MTRSRAGEAVVVPVEHRGHPMADEERVDGQAPPYFGSFYMKDIPAMGRRDYPIRASLTGDSGEAFLAALTEPQRRLVTQRVEQQRAALAEIVATRRSIASALRRFMRAPSADRAHRRPSMDCGDK